MPSEIENVMQEYAWLLKKNGLIPWWWHVIDDKPGYITVRHRITGTVAVLHK